MAATFVGAAHGTTVTAGWQLDAALGGWFERVDHWIAFVLLVGLGVRSMLDAARMRGDGADGQLSADRAFAPKLLLVLAIATSIDGIAAGVSVPLLTPPPGVTIAIIAGTTFAISFAAAFAGRALGARLGGRLGLLGGAALCAIGVKILVEHVE
jgi:putative Mn2+ efflux pump MntP